LIPFRGSGTEAGSLRHVAMTRGCSPEVRSLLSVLYPPNVAPYWLALPLRTCSGEPERTLGSSAGWVPSRSHKRIIRSQAFRLSRAASPGCESNARKRGPCNPVVTPATLRYASPRLRPAARSPSGASPEVHFPFSANNAVSPFLGSSRRRSLTSGTQPAAGLPHPRHFHLQGFSPSWRLSPHSTSSVCFTRQALMGFRAHLSTFPLG
jgi:hypothetical protein